MKRLNLPHQPTRLDYVLVVLLLCLSGNQAFVTGARHEPLLLLMALLVSLRMLLLRRGLATSTFLAVSLSYLLILAFQAVTLPYLASSTILGFLVKLVIGVGVISTVRFFRLAYVRAMVGLAVLSLLIHVPAVLAGLAGVRVDEIMQPIADIVGAQPEGVNLRVNILVHNFMDAEGRFRNSGLFWEPGAFSGYLIMAIVFLATIRAHLPASTMKRWRLILVAALLSTLSTSGYLLLPFALFIFRLVELEERGDMVNRILWLVLFLLALIPLTSVLWQLDFLGPKIEALLNRAVNQDAGWQVSRFGAVIFDWTHIVERPLFGWSQADPALYSLYPALENFATGNGLSGYLREMGVLGLLLFLVFFWRGLGQIGVTQWTRLMAFLLLVFQLNGQSYLTYPLYLGLHFIGLERHPRLRSTSGRERFWTAQNLFMRRRSYHAPASGKLA